jgi:hypothetical protein
VALLHVVKTMSYVNYEDCVAKKKNGEECRIGNGGPGIQHLFNQNLLFSPFFNKRQNLAWKLASKIALT